MKTFPIPERLVYVVVVVLAVTALLLLELSPPNFLNVSGVYQGF